MSRPRWYAKRGPATFSVEAGAGVHHVTWHAGRLVLHDHDLSAEAVLQALGGEPELCLCLLLREALRGPPRATWLPGFVRPVPAPSGVAVSRSAAPPMGFARPPVPPRAPAPRAPAAAARQTLQQWQSDPNFQRLPAERRNRLLRELGRQVVAEIIPEPMREILVVAEELRAARRSRQADTRRPRPTADELLQAAAAPVLEEAMRQAQGHFRPDAALSVGCWKQSPGEIPILQGDLTSRGGFVTLSLPVRWLNRVWKRGLACVDGAFVLDVDRPAPATELSGEAVRWERRLGGHSVPVAAPCKIRWQAGRWQLAW